MGYVFTGGSTKIIQLTAGTTELDVKDMYSRWKEWILNTGSGQLYAFSVVGGDPIDEANGIYVTSYLFLSNGWRVRPQEADHKLRVYNGVLLTIEGDDPFLQTQGSYNVLVQYSQPVRSEAQILSVGGDILTVPTFLALK